MTPNAAPSGEGVTAAELCVLFTHTPDEASASVALEELFARWIMPWCTDAVHRNLACYGLRDSDRTDVEAETTAEVLLAITARLRAVRTGTADPVENIRAYLSSTAQNACFARIRARCPRHVQLQNRVRYVLRNDARFARWANPDGEQLAGLQEWQGRADFLPCPDAPGPELPLDSALAQLFRHAEGPVRLIDLIRALSLALNIAEAPAGAIDPESLPSGDRGIDTRIVQKEQLIAIWKEVRELPQQQRSALLLNLRDADGQGVIELVPASGAASFAELASMLGMEQVDLARVWPGLPLDDSKIGELLGITRQQVINLRKSARARLGRRMLRGTGNTGRVSTSNVDDGFLARAGSAFSAILRRKGEQ